MGTLWALAHLAACSAALGALTAAKGFDKRCFDAGAVPVLVRTIKTMQRNPMKALLKITSSGDPTVLEAAKDAGAKDEWLMPAAEGDEEKPDSPTKGKSGRINVDGA